MKLFLSILAVTFQSIALLAHPTHMSVVNMELNADSLEITYTIRVFQDDMNHLISSLYHEELFHSTDTFDLSQHTEKIDSYFLENLKLTADSNTLEAILVKKESLESDYSLFYTIKLQELPKKLQIENKLLLDQYANQTNLVIFSFDNEEKGLTFDYNTQIQNIYLDDK